MWENIKKMIMKLFGVSSDATDSQLSQYTEDVKKYQDKSQINFTSIFANKLAKYAFNDSTISVVSDGESTKRSLLLSSIATKEWKNVMQNIEVGLGCGLIASIPYSVDNGNDRKIYIDTVTKDRFVITGIQGDDIISASVISDIKKIGNRTYIRFTDYSIEKHTYVIRQKATCDGSEVALSSVDDWALISPEIRIANVRQLPIGIFRCPTSNRRPKTVDGVPITYGCDNTINKIIQTIEDIEREYDKKKPRIFADSFLFDREKKVDADLYELVRGSGGKLGGEQSLITIFDPAIRDISYYNKLDRLFSQLEKEIGTSKGVLTEISTNGATATEIRRSMYDTFCLCDSIQSNAENYFNNLIYGCDILANFYNMTPASEYKIQYDWSYGLIEDSATTWKMKLDAASYGAERKAELRRFNHPDETMEEAQAVIDEISDSEPTIGQLVGE